MRSPFATARFEHEGGAHLYYLPANLVTPLEDARPVYLIGSRGTGKTTLLQALSWQERLNNASLRKQLDGDPFAGHYIGLYLKLPRLQLHALSEWLDEVHARPAGKGSIISLYLDLAWLELGTHALLELSQAGVLNWKLAAEHDGMRQLLSDLPAIQSYLPKRGPITICAVGDAFTAMRRRLESFAHSTTPIAAVAQSLPLLSPGECGRLMSQKLLAVANLSCTPHEPQWYFKYCMDEGESLDSFQQMVVNTLTRHAESSAFPVISYVRPPDDLTGTLDPALRLQKADRELIYLDGLSDAVFCQLVEGITSVRIASLLQNDNACFNTRFVLGSLNINQLLASIINDSTNKDARALLAEAESLAAHPFFAHFARQSEQADAAPPLYEAYLIRQLKLVPPSPDAPAWERRAQDSAELRKRMVAAYLSICHDLNCAVRYASADMLLQMSDGCVRDFLLQMNKVFHKSGRSVEEFTSHQVDWRTQDDALHEASVDKRDRVQDEVKRKPIEVEHLVTGLATVTAAIQRTSPNGEHLRSSERGRFVVHLDAPTTPLARRILDLISEAGDAGYFRLISTEATRWQFQVHASLAAAFGFSYRGAQYLSPVAISDLSKVVDAVDLAAVDRAAKALGRKLTGYKCAPDATLPLFEEE